ncbi:hypothetical protein GCM10017744_018110 [Streptomyces antimycoticus]|uniref:Uncharacterized protein n=1 Tax=Streptomyces antimycoticus TaxID=68175 RepID=A0A4D4KH17_9ACTN|nr:hypothetical protein SANT12839_083560 [Streptomyces antimycoticus]
MWAIEVTYELVGAVVEDVVSTDIPVLRSREVRSGGDWGRAEETPHSPCGAPRRRALQAFTSLAVATYVTVSVW